MKETGDSRQLRWLHYLQSLQDRPVETAKNVKGKEGFHPGERRPIGVWPEVDYRTVLEKEVVFDIDHPEYGVVRKIARKVAETLQLANIPHLIALTGGKGVHIHVFFDATGSDPKKMAEAKKLGLQCKDIRLWLWNRVLDMAGTGKEHRGRGKLLDSACVGWDDRASGQLIRDIGGQKFVEEDGEPRARYKHLVAEIPERRGEWPSAEEVVFPEKVEVYQIPLQELNEFLERFIEEKKERPLAEPVADYPGKHLSLPCIAKLRQGLREGQRNFGCQLLTIACKCDRADEKTARAIVEEYSSRCESQLTGPEKEGWLRWTGGIEGFWTCGQPKELGLCSPEVEASCPLKAHAQREELDLLRSPRLSNEIQEALDQTIVDERKSRTTLLFNCASVWLPEEERVHSEITGPSSGGKTVVAKGVLGIFPEDMVLDFSRITGTAMDYTDIDFHKKIMFIGEGAGANAAIESIKTHTDNISGGTKVLCTIKDKETGRMTAEKRESKGHPVIVTTSAKIIEDVEFVNRLVTIGIDTSEAQTERIIKRQAESALIWGAEKKALATKKNRIRKALGLLEPVEVIVPYSDELIRLFPRGQVRTRRDYKKFLGMVKGCAALHQFQRLRVVDAEGHIAVIATEEDAEIVYGHAWENVALTTAGLDKTTKDLLDGIHGKMADLKGEFTIADLRRKGVTFQSSESVRKKLEILEDLGYLEKVEGGRGKVNVYCLVGEEKAHKLQEPPNGKFDINTLREKVENCVLNLKKRNLQILEMNKRGWEIASHASSTTSPIFLLPPVSGLEVGGSYLEGSTLQLEDKKSCNLQIGGIGYIKTRFLKDTPEFVGYPDGKTYGPAKAGEESVIPEANFRALLVRGAVGEASSACPGSLSPAADKLLPEWPGGGPLLP